jgi:hypothetical protein
LLFRLLRVIATLVPATSTAVTLPSPIRRVALPVATSIWNSGCSPRSSAVV